MARSICFHLDECCDPAIADGLRRRGIGVTTSQDAGLLRAEDDRQAAYGLAENRVVLTHDTDFRGPGSIGAENRHKPSSLLDSSWTGRFSPLPLELVLDVDVGKIEVDGRRLEPVVAQDLLDRRQADSLLQGRRGERVPQHMRAHILGDPRTIGHRLDDVLGSPRLDRERRLQREVVLQECLLSSTVFGTFSSELFGTICRQGTGDQILR